MARGFLSEGSGRRESSNDEGVEIDLELGWATDKAWGFRDPFDTKKPHHLVGGSKEKLIWVAKSTKDASWSGPPRQGTGKLTAPRWILERSGLI